MGKETNCSLSGWDCDCDWDWEWDRGERGCNGMEFWDVVR